MASVKELVVKGYNFFNEDLKGKYLIGLNSLLDFKHSMLLCYYLDPTKFIYLNYLIIIILV